MACRLIFILCFIIFQKAVIAQSNKDIIMNYNKEWTFSEEENDWYQQQINEKLNEFQSYLSLMTSKELTNEEKKVNKEVAAELFINKGKTVVVEIIFKSTVTGEILKKNMPLLSYLDKLCMVPYYDKVEVLSSKVFHISKLYNKGNDSEGNPVYEGLATTSQKFVENNHIGEPYRDNTYNTTKIQILMKKDLSGARWMVLLGDISVVETK